MGGGGTDRWNHGDRRAQLPDNSKASKADATRSVPATMSPDALIAPARPAIEKGLKLFGDAAAGGRGVFHERVWAERGRRCAGGHGVAWPAAARRARAVWRGSGTGRRLPAGSLRAERVHQRRGGAEPRADVRAWLRDAVPGRSVWNEPRDDLRDKLSRAIDLIVRTQNAEGGWRYQPRREDADISVTICQVMALRAARNAGLRVPNETVDRCVEYVKKSQNADGGFRYMLHAGGESQFPRSAAGVVALYSAGVYEGPRDRRGAGVSRSVFAARGRVGGQSQDGHFFYGHYYAVQAMWQASGERWERWYPAIRDVLVSRQQPDGSWADPVELGIRHGDGDDYFADAG